MDTLFNEQKKDVTVEKPVEKKKIAPTITVIKASDSTNVLSIGTCHCSS